MSEHLTNIVVVGFIHRDGKIFIAKRAATKAAMPDRFEIPGGHLDPGEKLTAALKREIMEEIQIDVEVGTLFDAFTYTSEDTFKVELCYLCELVDNTREPVLNPVDHSIARWISKDEIKLFEKEDEETAALRKAFDLLEKGVK
jgi:8-oxo-dGTP diphosphatase